MPLCYESSYTEVSILQDIPVSIRAKVTSFLEESFPNAIHTCLRLLFSVLELLPLFFFSCHRLVYFCNDK
jgi:hypothetical protein